MLNKIIEFGAKIIKQKDRLGGILTLAYSYTPRKRKA